MQRIELYRGRSAFRTEIGINSKSDSVTNKAGSALTAHRAVFTTDPFEPFIRAPNQTEDSHIKRESSVWQGQKDSPFLRKSGVGSDSTLCCLHYRPVRILYSLPAFKRKTSTQGGGPSLGRGRRIRTLNKGFGDPRVTITPCPYCIRNSAIIGDRYMIVKCFSDR